MHRVIIVDIEPNSFLLRQQLVQGVAGYQCLHACHVARRRLDDKAARSQFGPAFSYFRANRFRA